MNPEINSQYGTMWITNGTENKKIKKDEPIPEGWNKGRVNVHPDGYKKHLENKTINYNTEKRKKTILEKYGSLRTEAMINGYTEYVESLKNEKQNQNFEDKSTYYKRLHILNEQDNKCLHCRLSEWLDKPIKFELDHINGDVNDNTRDNLRILCPNCHSYTDTWRKKKNKRV